MTETTTTTQDPGTPAPANPRTPAVETRREARRGCGYRKPGGLYMVSDGEGAHVPCLPVPLHVCPTCSQGVKPGRGFQWIEPGKLFPSLDPIICPFHPPTCECSCLLKTAKEGTQGLMWIGGKYYPTPENFLKESHTLGISKRVPFVPRDFILGMHWIYLAHREAFPATPQAKAQAGVFSVFKPTAIEYIVKPDDDQKKLLRLMSRGINLVDVVPIPDPEETSDTCPDTCPDTRPEVQGE